LPASPGEWFNLGAMNNEVEPKSQRGRLPRVWAALALAICCMGVGARAGVGPPKWKFLYLEDHIKMYEAQGTDLPTFKAEGVIPVNLLDLLAVIADVPRRPEWLQDIEVSRIIEGNVESRVVIYEIFNMPWPLKDRDALVESNIYKDFEKGTVSVTFQQIELPSVPPVDGMVRIPVVEGVMTYRYVDEEHTAATYEATLDVDSSLPDWIIELAVRRVPIYTLQAVTQQVQRTRGQYAAFVRAQKEKLDLHRK
jgi:hypothetical protein